VTVAVAVPVTAGSSGLVLVDRLLDDQGLGREQHGDAAAGTMPSSSAARVACSASSTRCFFSFISVSVAAPTLTTATPPASFARRSWSFSRSKSESVFSISA
jgi:hypothetical protein